MKQLSERISEDMRVPFALVDEALSSAHYRYKKFKVKKRSGGYRTMIQPSAELKLVHEWLIANILSKLPVSRIATAFRAGASIVKNAYVHRASKYSVRVDVTEFFSSIRSGDLFHSIDQAGPMLLPWALSIDSKDLIRTACFDKEDRLPIGYPTSPCIANAVMFALDSAILAMLAGDKDCFGNAVVTRYADDFVFSTDKKGACHAFVEGLRGLFAKVSSPRLRINERKTRYMSRQGGSFLITGLRITEDGTIGVHPNYKDHVRLLLKLYATGKLKNEEVMSLRGHLSFVENADPKLFTRLSFRYFEQIAFLRANF